MNCPDLAELDSYVEGGADDASRSTIETHISGCEACRKQVVELRENLNCVAPLRRAVAKSGKASPPISATKFSDYEIVREIGRGGMGVVYEARQQSPRRSVALKVLHSYRAGDEHYDRLFQREIQALARLKHASIAAIFEASKTDDGRAFFTMELVEGLRLFDHLSKTTLDRDAKLRLFREICEAVAHAHRMGIIHRDLKPSNILVTAEGRPKVLDFGLAKTLETDAGITAHSLETDPGHVKGTIPYMSPEQVRGRTDEIDVRSDVYSLGVVLYEMLLGRSPYESLTRNLAHAARIISESPPIRPRSCDATIDADLESIVLKTLEKSPERRYQSASALSEDIERFLTNQPILARPAGTMYSLRLAMRRHRAAFAAAVVVLLVLAGASVVSTGMYLRAEAARVEAASQRDKAVAAEHESALRLKESEAVTKFMTDIIASAKPAAAKGKDVTVLEAVEQAAEKVSTGFADQPSLEAHVRLALAVTFRSLGKDAMAEQHMREAQRLRPYKSGDEVWQSDLLTGMAQVLRRTGNLKEAEEYARKAVEYAAIAFPPEDEIRLAIQNNLAIVLEKTGKLQESEQIHRDILAVRKRTLGEQHPNVLRTKMNLAATLLAIGKLEEAESLTAEVLEWRRKNIGPKHPDLATALNNLGGMKHKLKKYDAAESLFRESIDMWAALGIEQSPELANLTGNLGAILCEMNRPGEGVEFARKSAEMHQKLSGPEHWTVGNARGIVGKCLLQAGDMTAAEVEIREGHRLMSAGLGAEHAKTKQIAAALIDLLNQSNQTEKAEQFRASLADDKPNKQPNP